MNYYRLPMFLKIIPIFSQKTAILSESLLMLLRHCSQAVSCCKLQPLSSDCELVDAETSSTMSMGSGSDCDAPITEDSSESEEEVSSSDSEKDVHSSEDEYELGTPDDAGPSGSQAVDEGPSYDTDE